MIGVDRLNIYVANFTIIGWLTGLAYYNWFASAPHHLPPWAHAILVVAGSFAACIVIGAGMAILAGAVTQLVTGRHRGSPYAFGWGAFISPVLAFFAAKFVLQLAATVWP